MGNFDGDISDEFDMDDDGGLYVNFSEQEASSEARDIEPLPSGKYLVTITDVDLRSCGPESKNPGKPYYAIEMTVVEDKRGGEYVNRKCWTNAMLFSPALYTISHIMKALDMEVNPGRLKAPAPKYLIDQVIMIGGMYIGETKDKKDPSKVYQPKFEVKSIFAKTKWDGQAGTKGAGTVTGKAAGARSSLLS
jgi:hypothetical protein